MSLVAELDLDTGRFDRKMNQARKSADKGARGIERATNRRMANVRRAFVTMGDSIASATSRLAQFGVAAAGTAGAAIAFAGNQAIVAAEGFDKMSQRTGFTVEALSTLKFAAEQSGTSVQTLENGIKRFSRNIIDAGDGMQSATRAFDRLGVAWRDSSGQLKSNEQLLGEVATAFSVLEDETTKVAVAQELFGRSGADMIPLLNQGADGMEALQEQARRLGIEIDTNTSKAAAQHIDDMNALTKAWDGFGIAIARDALPTMNRITSAIVKATEQAGLFKGAIAGAQAAWKEWTDFVTGGSDESAELIAHIQDLDTEILALQNTLEAQRNSAALPFGGASLEDMDKTLAKIKEARAQQRMFREQLAGTISGAGWEGPDPADFAAATAGVNTTTGEPIAPTGVPSAEKVLEDQNRMQEQTLAFYERQREAKAERDAAELEDERRLAEGKLGLEKWLADQEEALHANTWKAKRDTARKGFSALAQAAMSGSGNLFRIGKKLAIADAIVNSHAAFTSALKNPPGPPFTIPMAAAALIQGMNQVKAIKSATPGFARGTDYAPGGPAIVGEQGPELVNLPRGSKVTPADQTRRMLGQPSFALNFEPGAIQLGPGSGSQQAEDFVDSLARMIRQGEAPGLVRVLQEQMA